jgi:hypothetical protein
MNPYSEHCTFFRDLFEKLITKHAYNRKYDSTVGVSVPNDLEKMKNLKFELEILGKALDKCIEKESTGFGFFDSFFK